MKYQNVSAATLHLYDARFVAPTRVVELTDEDLATPSVVAHIDAGKLVVEKVPPTWLRDVEQVAEEVAVTVVENDITRDIPGGIGQDIDNAFNQFGGLQPLPNSVQIPIKEVPPQVEESVKASTVETTLTQTDGDTTLSKPKVPKKASPTKKKPTIT